MGQVLAVVSQKGGVGKTTTAVNLGAAFARRGLKTLIVDTDPQGAVRYGVGLKRGHETHGLADFLNGTRALREVVLATRMSGREKLELLAGMWSCRPTRSAQEWFSDCREVAVCRGSHEASHRGTVQARRVLEDCRFAAQRYTSPIVSRVCCASALSASIWQRTWMI